MSLGSIFQRHVAVRNLHSIESSCASDVGDDRYLSCIRKKQPLQAPIQGESFKGKRPTHPSVPSILLTRLSPLARLPLCPTARPPLCPTARPLAHISACPSSRLPTCLAATAFVVGGGGGGRCLFGWLGVESEVAARVVVCRGRVCGGSADYDGRDGESSDDGDDRGGDDDGDSSGGDGDGDCDGDSDGFGDGDGDRWRRAL